MQLLSPCTEFQASVRNTPRRSEFARSCFAAFKTQLGYREHGSQASTIAPFTWQQARFEQGQKFWKFLLEQAPFDKCSLPCMTRNSMCHAGGKVLGHRLNGLEVIEVLEILASLAADSREAGVQVCCLPVQENKTFHWKADAMEYIAK